MRLYFLAGIVFMGFSTVLGGSYRFDCNSLQGSCSNGGSCGRSGTCDCADGFDGYDCNFLTSSTLCSTDPDFESPCLNGGTCYMSTDDPPVTRCYCQYGYFGDKCADEIATIDCGGNTAEYILSLPVEFIGEIVLVDVNGTSLASSCPVTTTEAERKTFSLSVDITDGGTETGVPCKQENVVVFNGSTFQARFLVSYRKNMITSKDEYFILNCSHAIDDVLVDFDIKNVSIISGSINEVNGSKTFNPVVVEIFDEDNNTLGSEDSTLEMGALTRLYIYPKVGSEYTSVFFETCTANNSLPIDNGYMSAKFLDKGCPTPDYGAIIGASQEIKNKEITTQTGNGTVVETVEGKAVAFLVFRFTNSKLLGISCTCRVCKEGDPACTVPENCTAALANSDDQTTNVDDTTDAGGETTTAGTENGGRKRRKRAADNAETQTTVSKVFTVVGKKVNTDDKTSSGQEAGTSDPVKECLARTEITAVVAVLGAVVCVLLIVCFFLTCVILRRKGKRITTYDPTLFQPKPDRFPIPRAHVNESYEIM